MDQLWYRDFPRSKFHSFDDSKEWLQVDKCGHAFTAYQLSSALTDIYAWSGHTRNRSLLLGSATSLMYMTSIELLDARSAAWGFSWSDMVANCSGVLLYAAQEKFMHTSSLQIKFSYTPSHFADDNSDVLGRNFQQRLLKDYNAQTYWLSYNMSSMTSVYARFPRWLNVAVGYGATKMLHAKNDVNSVNNFQPTREFYLSFDADLNRVRCKKIWVKRWLRCLSFIKLPSPTLEIQNDGQMKFHFLFF
ncbi:MAG: DUF2279 domain-containing protein [Flavobacteriales bacterium]